MNTFKKIICYILCLCICISIAPTVIFAADEEVEINGVVSFENDDTIEDCSPLEDEIVGVELSGDIEIDGVLQEDDLDGGEIDIDSVSVSEEDSSIQNYFVEEDFTEVDALEEELDGGSEENLPPEIAEDNGVTTVLQETTTEELSNVIEDTEDLDGASSSTKGYKLTISASKVIKGSKIKVSWTFKNNANHGILYAILGNKAYPVNVTGNGSKSLTLPTSGKWRICMIAYNKNNKCIYNGYTKTDGSLYVNVGTPPSGYGMSYSITNRTQYNFKVTADNASSYDAVILKDGVEYTRRNFSGSTKGFSISPKKVGYYQVYLILYNSYGSYNGKAHNRVLGFTCKAPGIYSWSISSTNIKLGNKVNFTVKNLNNATSAELIILKDFKIVAKTKRFSGNINIGYTPTDSGTYRAYMVTYNDYGSYNGLLLSSLSFKVNGSPEPYNLNIQGSYFSPGECIRISMNAKNADYFYMYIQKVHSNGGSSGTEYITYFSKKFSPGQYKTVTGNITIPESGEYRIYLSTYNEHGSFKGYSNGIIKYFTISDTKNFQIGKHDYQFSNSPSSFGYTYNVDKISLQAYQDVFGKTSGWWKYKLDDTWGGSCFGFATTAALSYSNYIDKFGKTYLYDVVAPGSKEHKVTQRIERYQLSQNLKDVEKARNKTKNNFSGLINEVADFEKNGGIPIVIGVSSDSGGHAVIARSVFKDSWGRYIINVCDNNYPTDKNMNIIIDSDLNGFVYRSGSYKYTKTLKYCRADVMYNAMPSNVRLLSVLDGNSNDESSDSIRIYTNADVFTIKNSVGDNMLLSNDCIVVSKYETGTSANEYILPKDTYTIEFENYHKKEVSCSVSDDADALITSGTASSGVFYVGIEDYSGKIKSVMDITNPENDNTVISAEYMNSSAEIQKFEAYGRYLGANVSSLGLLQINTDVDSIKQNGITVDLTTKEPDYEDDDLDGGSATFSSFSFDNNLDDLDGFENSSNQDYSLCITNNTLDRTEGILTGKIGVAVQNNIGKLAEEKPYIAFYENGKLLDIKQQSVIIGENTSYFEVDVNDLEVLSNDEITIKIFLWNDNMSPKANAVSLSI